MNQTFAHWSQIKYLKDTIQNPNIQVGDYSYYAGYYHQREFSELCVRYLYGDDYSRTHWNPESDYGWQVDRLKIGRYCCVASGVTILLGGNHNHNPSWITVYPFGEKIAESYRCKGDTVIGNDVWLGSEAMLMPGITIGDGAIIAARSVVTRDVPPYTLVAGNPARIVRRRFCDEQIAALLKMAWWNWPQSAIQQAIDLLSSSDIDGLQRYYQENISPSLS